MSDLPTHGPDRQHAQGTPARPSSAKEGVPDVVAFAGVGLLLAWIAWGVWMSIASLANSTSSFSLESLRASAASALSPDPEASPIDTEASPEATPEATPEAAPEAAPEALTQEVTDQEQAVYAGWTLLSKDEPKEAEIVFTAALATVDKADDLHARLLIGRGDARVLQGNRREARTDYDAALAAFDRTIALEKAKEEPDDDVLTQARRGRTLALAKVGRHADQATELSRLLLESSDETTYSDAADLLEAQVRAGLRVEAQQLTEGLSSEDEEPGLRLVVAVYLSVAALDRKDLGAARDLVGKALALSTDQPEIAWDFLTLKNPLVDATTGRGACVSPVFKALTLAPRGHADVVRPALTAYAQCLATLELTPD